MSLAGVAGRPIDEVLVSGKVAIPQVVVQATQERVEPYRVGLQIADADVVYLEIGDRTPGDEGRYPDDDLKAPMGPDGRYFYTRKDGSPL